MPDNEAKWYVVHTYSGYENKVKSTLETTVENRGMKDLIQEVRVPVEKVTEIKDMLYSGNFKVNKDYVEAKSLATVAYIVLSEAWKIATENAEITKSKHP